MSLCNMPDDILTKILEESAESLEDKIKKITTIEEINETKKMLDITYKQLYIKINYTQFYINSIYMLNFEMCNLDGLYIIKMFIDRNHDVVNKIVDAYLIVLCKVQKTIKKQKIRYTQSDEILYGIILTEAPVKIVSVERDMEAILKSKVCYKPFKFSEYYDGNIQLTNPTIIRKSKVNGNWRIVDNYYE